MCVVVGNHFFETSAMLISFVMLGRLLEHSEGKDIGCNHKADAYASMLRCVVLSFYLCVACSAFSFYRNKPNYNLLIFLTGAYRGPLGAQ